MTTKLSPEKAIEGLSDFDTEYIKAILDSKGDKQKNAEIIKKLKEYLINSQKDTTILQSHIKAAEDVQSKLDKSKYKKTNSNLNNYISSLKNIVSQKGFEYQYTEEGKVVKTFPPAFITKDNYYKIINPPQQPASEPTTTTTTTTTTTQEEPAPPAKQPPAVLPPVKLSTPPKTIQQAIIKIKANVPGSYKDFTDLIGKSKIKELKPAIVSVGGKRYSKLKLGELKKLLDDTIRKIAKDEKLDIVLSEMDAPKIEYEKQKEKTEMASMPEEEFELMYGKKTDFDIDKYIREKYELPRDKQITNFLLSYDKRDNAVYFKSNIKIPDISEFSKRKIRTTIDDLFTNNIYINRINKEINNRKNTKLFKESDQLIKADIINNSIKAGINADDINEVLQDNNFQDFLAAVYRQVHQKQPDNNINTVAEYYQLVEDIRKLSASSDYVRLANIAGDITKYYNINIQPEEEKLKKLINQEVNKPADIRVLPEGVKIKPVEAELLSDLDKYNKLAEELAQETKKDITEQDQDLIKQIKEDMAKYVEGAKKEKQRRTIREAKSATATSRTGALRPHFKNTTEKAVAAAIGETPEEQIRDIKNWWIFDIPVDQTGVGSNVDNPLVRQNNIRERMLLNVDNIYNHMDSYLLDEGVNERKKDFYIQHSKLDKKAVDIGLQQIKYDEEEQEFLQKFNDGSNGLFSQDQSKKEVNDFQNIYQKPGRYIENGGQPLQYTTNKGITHTDKEFINNLNLFYKGAVIE